MKLGQDLWLRLRAILFPSRAEADLRDELGFHLAMRIRRNVQRGMSVDEARAEALRAFGSPALVADDCRDERRIGLVEVLQRDVRFAYRSLARHPGFTTVAVLTLALGIGANTALFSIADPLLTRQLPVRSPEELVLFRTVGSPAFPRWAEEGMAPYALFEQIQAGSTAFAGAFVAEPVRRMRARDAQSDGFGELAWAIPVSGAFFDLLGVTPVLGRAFTTADDQRGAPPLAVISYAFWQRRYGGAPDIVGQILSLEPADTPLAVIPGAGVAATIVGVAPRGFHGVDLDLAPDAWLTRTPVTNRPDTQPGRADQRIGRIMARLRPGVSLRQAQAEVDVLAGPVLQGMSLRWVDERTRIQAAPGAAGQSALRERFRTPLYILIPAVGFVLLMACTNVAALLLARVVSRQKEMAVRLSLGSGRLAIVRLLFAESLLLAAAGGAAGLLVFRWVRLAATAYLPPESGLLATITFDARLFLFVAGVSLLSALLFGLWPAVWTARADLGRLIREPQGSAHVSGSVAALHRVIVPVQIAFALALLTGAVLSLRTLENLREVDTGFARGHLMQFSLDARVDPQRSLLENLSTPAAVLERLEALPGVASLSSYQGGLLQGGNRTATLKSTGAPPREAVDVSVVTVSARFFETMGITLVAGREAHPDGAPPFGLAILSESLARHLFGHAETAVGQTVVEENSSIAPYRTVVGVAENVTHTSLREAQGWTMYVLSSPRAPLAADSVIVLRTTGDAALMAPSVRAVVRELGDGYQIRQMQTFRDITEASIAGERLLAQVSSLFGGLAVLLAAIGVYGVIAYAVAQRTAEIGLRMALGARAGDVIALVVRRMLALVAAGMAIGLLGAWFGARLASNMLFGVAPHDPVAAVTSLLILTTVGGIAACMPAYRAARRIDPIVALRGE